MKLCFYSSKWKTHLMKETKAFSYNVGGFIDFNSNDTFPRDSSMFHLEFLTSPRPSPSPSPSLLLKGKGNFASGLSIKSHRTPTPPMERHMRELRG